MSNEAVITVSNDPLKSVADALDAAVQGAKGGVEDLRVTASGALPALRSFLSGLTYKTCYASPTELSFPQPWSPERSRKRTPPSTGSSTGRVPRSTWSMR